LTSQQKTALTSQTSRFDTQITQTNKRDFTEERKVFQESYTIRETIDHIQITSQQYFRSASQTVASSFQMHEQVKSYQQTVNQWQKSSQQNFETASQWQQGSN